MEGEHICAFAQHAIYQVLQDWRAAFRIQPLAMHDAYAPQSCRARFLQEATQQGFRLPGIAVVKVEFFLCRVFAVAQPAQYARRYFITAVVEWIPRLQKRGVEGMAECVASIGLVALGHLGARFGFWLRWWCGRHGQFAYGADRRTEQG